MTIALAQSLPMASAGAPNCEASIKAPTASFTYLPTTNLPGDILIDILLRLPVLFLVRFRCVCKSWRNLFDNPEFIKLHLKCQALIKNKGGCLLLKHRPDSIVEVFSLRNSTTFDEVGKLEVPVPSRTGYFQIVECCRGLICLVESSHWGTLCYSTNAILWNPSIREFKVLPYHMARFANPHTVVGLGFAFHPIVDDFKMVRFVFYLKTNMCEIEVYSLSTDSWKIIKNTPNILKEALFDNYLSQAFVNGALHWMVTNSYGQNYNAGDLILSFDVGEYKFKEIMLPNFDYYYDGFKFQISLTMFRESISVLAYNPLKMNDNCDIWVMKEHGVVDSWTKLYTVTHDVEFPIPLGFFNNDDIIKMGKHASELVSCNLDVKRRMNLRFFGLARIVEYTESLVSVKGRNEQLCGAA